LAALQIHRDRETYVRPTGSSVYGEQQLLYPYGTWWGLWCWSGGARKERQGEEWRKERFCWCECCDRFARRHLYVDCVTIDVIFCPFSRKTNWTAKDDVCPTDELNTKREPPVDIPPLDLVSYTFVFVLTDGSSIAGEKPRCSPNTWPPPFCHGGGMMLLFLLWSAYSDKLIGFRCRRQRIRVDVRPAASRTRDAFIVVACPFMCFEFVPNMACYFLIMTQNVVFDTK